MFLENTLNFDKQTGWIEVVCGSMFSGKTEELIRRVRRAKFANLDVTIFKPILDKRDKKNTVVSHDDTTIDCKTIKRASEIYKLSKKCKVVGIDDIKFDTLSNGKVIAKSLPGQLAQVPVDEDETYLRPNFDTSDNRNFRDGDRQSTRYFGETQEGDLFPPMYDSPQHSVKSNQDGSLDRKFDKSDTRTSLVNDKVRVYKGGSWKDREFWLDPAQRRFYPEDMATDFIGFRCAMSRVGSKSKTKKKKN